MPDMPATAPVLPEDVPVGAALRDLFLLDPKVTFLNHGSFGACPRPVFETYQAWQLELERQPVAFLGRRHDALMDTAREALARFLTADPANLVYVPNATAGINLAARSLPLQPGDEILTTDHEYGAINYTWEFVCQQTGARLVPCPLPLPMTTQEDIVERLWEAVTPRTRVIAISHVTAPTALILPVADLCRRARAAGILTVIDGAHAPGQVEVNLQAIDPDFYTGNCHKWMCAPKGSAFLYAHPDHHALIKPLVISWGWSETASYVSRCQQQGTRDISAFLSVPAAIEFQAAHHWDAVRAYCHQLASDARRQLGELTGLAPLSPDSPAWFSQMVTCPLPDGDPVELKTRLYDEFGVEAPLWTWNEQNYIRISFQGYNTSEDTARLMEGLTRLLAR